MLGQISSRPRAACRRGRGGARRYALPVPCAEPDLCRRSHKIGNSTWCAVPNEDMKPAFPQIIGYRAADDSQANYPDIFSCAN